jgi:aminopeptidase
MITEAQLKKYAALLVNYSVGLKSGERLLIDSTTLAEPLVRAIYTAALEVGAIPFTLLTFENQSNIRHQYANEQQIAAVNPLYAEAMQNFDAYIVVRAPYPNKKAIAPTEAQHNAYNAAHAPYRRAYAERTANLSLRRNLCEYPTETNAAYAGMTLSEYSDFIQRACFLHEENPTSHWLEISRFQQQVVDYLNKCKTLRYVNAESDLTMSIAGRKWMNSDGRTNMPSGEVFSSPVEDAVNGQMYFDYPSVFQGETVQGIRLWVRDGEIYKWEAKEGGALLDRVFAVPGARRFGEVAIGCNYNIQTPVKNILFDEKIGGTVHLAVGDTYLQTGGTNQSAIHWDMISDMKNGGAIYADGQKIYEDGKFLIVG